MEVIAEIRRRHLVSKESISSIARDLKLSRPTVRKHLQTESEAVYLRSHQPAPKLGDFQSVLESWLATERHLPKAQRRTAQRRFEGLQAEGYRGAYDSVQRFVKQWKKQQGKTGNLAKQLVLFDHLLGITRIQLIELQARGGFTQLEKNLPAAEKTHREEIIAGLNQLLRDSSDQIATAFPGVGVGFYHKGLDAIITYGPSIEYGNTVGKSISDDHDPLDGTMLS